MKTLSRVAVLMVLVCVIAAQSVALADEAFHLITPEEHAREQAAGQARASSPVSAPGAPAIKVVEPKDLDAIIVPVSIDIRFIPQDAQAIDINTLRVLYGWLELDITDRIRKYGTVTAAGIKAEKAKLPPGSHRITIKIADTRGVVGSREFSYHVVK